MYLGLAEKVVCESREQGTVLTAGYPQFSKHILLNIGLTQDSWNNEPLQAQRSRRNEDLRDILRKS